MAAEITRRDGEEVTVSVTIRLDGPMLEAEEAIQEALNEAGMLPTWVRTEERLSGTGRTIARPGWRGGAGASFRSRTRVPREVRPECGLQRQA